MQQPKACNGCQGIAQPILSLPGLHKHQDSIKRGLTEAHSAVDVRIGRGPLSIARLARTWRPVQGMILADEDRPYVVHEDCAIMHKSAHSPMLALSKCIPAVSAHMLLYHRA